VWGLGVVFRVKDSGFRVRVWGLGFNDSGRRV